MRCFSNGACECKSLAGLNWILRAICLWVTDKARGTDNQESALLKSGTGRRCEQLFPGCSEGNGDTRVVGDVSGKPGHKPPGKEQS